ncbi:MAG: hypothetical protein ACRC9V_07715, partial [Aeromonas sp.]
MSISGAKEYQAFLKFKEAFIMDIFSISVHHETKVIGGENVNVRPVGFIKTEEQLKHFTYLIEQWDDKVRFLTDLNPIVYPKSAKEFSPRPVIISRAASVSLAVRPVASVRTKQKSLIIKNITNQIKRLRKTNTAVDLIMIDDLTRQRDSMLADSETEYFSRNSNGTESSAIITPTEGEAYRIRVPFSGVLIDDRSGSVKFKMTRDNAPR